MEPRESEFATLNEAYATSSPPPRPDDATRELDETAEDLRNTVTDSVRKAKERLEDVYQRSSDAVGRAYDKAMDYSRENPSRATLIALGAGFGLGLVVAYSSGGRRRDRGMFPTLAAAVADTVLNVFDRR
jgi:ElaB/YqjD/DUF883 family membrane-anchored ribosome-binding protein